MNVMWLYLTGSGVITQDDLQELAGDCSSFYDSKFMPLLMEDCIHQFTQVTLYSSGDDARDAFEPSGTPGLADGSPTPASVAACISWNIAPHYRGGHPRTYLPGIPTEARSTVTTWGGSFLESATSAAQEFHTGLESIGAIGAGIETVEHGIVSFQSAGDWRDPPVFRRIIGARVDSRIDTQRRRLGRDRVA